MLLDHVFLLINYDLHKVNDSLMEFIPSNYLLKSNKIYRLT